MISNSHGLYNTADNDPNTILSGDLGQFFTNDENSNYTTSAPKAFLNYVAFDNQLNEVSGNSGVVQVPTITGSEQAQPLVAPEQIIQKDGYLYIYVSNESAQKVYFDNLVIHHNRGPILQTDSYYPFGLTMAGISDQAALSLENNYLFNGKLLNHKEFSDNTGLDWYSYGMREYDPQIGRFFRVDPLASKFSYLTPYQYASDDPISNIDVDGLEGMKFFLIPGGVQEFALENTLYKRNVAKGEKTQEASKQAEVQSAGIKVGVIAGGAGIAYLLSESGIIGAVRTLYGLFKGEEKLQAEETPKENVKIEPKKGSAGGPGSGKNFSEKVKNMAREESDNTCVFCGTKTSREAGSDQSNIDHAIPKVKGGNNTMENAQNTCRACNLQKGTRTTEEFQKDVQNGERLKSLNSN